jgi:hypothetical protein
VFNDKRAMQLRYLNSYSGRYDGIQPTIWYNRFDLGEASEMNQLEFEDNPSIHIFAITLSLG